MMWNRLPNAMYEALCCCVMYHRMACCTSLTSLRDANICNENWEKAGWLAHILKAACILPAQRAALLLHVSSILYSCRKTCLDAIFCSFFCSVHWWLNSRSRLISVTKLMMRQRNRTWISTLINKEVTLIKREVLYGSASALLWFIIQSCAMWTHRRVHVTSNPVMTSLFCKRFTWRIFMFTSEDTQGLQVHTHDNFFECSFTMNWHGPWYLHL